MEAVGEGQGRWPAVRRHTVQGLGTVALAAVLAVLIRVLVVAPFYVPSGSMRPTLEPGDYVLANRFVYYLHPPRRGDVIVFRYPRDERWDFVKRVIGLPGDVVEERGGRLWVNGAPVAEPYVLRASGGVPWIPQQGSWRVPPGRLFVLGDNREASLDSRFWGAVDGKNVIGKAFLIYWSRGDHWWDVRSERIGTWLR